ESSYEVLEGFLRGVVVTAKVKQQRGYVACFVAKRRSRGACGCSRNLFGPTSVSSLMNKKYCMVFTYDYSRFTWVFFIATKDETSSILKKFITEIENLVDKKVKVIRCDNEIEFKSSVARTPQQNGVSERRNMTLIKAARTMLADSKLPIAFWAEVVNTACYSSCDVGNIDDNGVNKDSEIDAHEKSVNSINDVNTVGPIINTVSTNFDTGSLNINIVSPTVSTTSPESTHVDFLGDKPEGDISNINTSYQVPSNSNTIIHKDYSLHLVIGDVQSGVLTRTMTKTRHEQGFISTVYEEKTHEDLNTCLFACFLS
nr:hypothetical protein [Tanacetum cinerariifolium]